jgi:antitoxin CcdA
MLTRPEPKPSSRTEVELALSEDLLKEAERLGIDVAEACERGLTARVNQAKADLWYQENRESVDYWNRYVEEHGLPLAQYRQF